MTTENTDKGQTPTEADSQGHCALGDGSAVDVICKNGSEWSARHWSAHHHSQDISKDVLRLRAALQSIADEACHHLEHNPVSGVDRLPHGYARILNLADDALNSPNKADMASGSQ